MIKIATLEDSDFDYGEYQKCLDQYKINNNLKDIQSTRFKDANSFFQAFNKGDFDIIFMDINLGEDNGMEASLKIRTIDKDVIIIFLTNLAQFLAARNHDVDALDFVLKPISYPVFSMKMQRALERLNKTKDVLLPFTINYEIIYIKASQLKYIEILGHKMIIHTTKGNYISYGSMKKVEEELARQNVSCFARCNNHILVNFNYVEGIYGMSVKIDDKNLEISYPKKQKFISDFNSFLNNGGIN